MNKKIEFRKYRLLQTIKYSSRSGNKEGYIKIYPNNSLDHERTKFLVAYKLKKQGFYVLSEVTFNNGKRTDLAVISPEGHGTLIEIIKSESKERYDEKLDSYPLEWDMLAISVDDFDIKTFEL